MTTSDKVKTSFDKKLAKDESSVKYDIVNAKKNTCSSCSR